MELSSGKFSPDEGVDRFLSTDWFSSFEENSLSSGKFGPSDVVVSSFLSDGFGRFVST